MTPASSDQDPEDVAARAESVWFEAAREASPDGQPDLEELCARHPELAGELRAIGADWGWLEGHVGQERVDEADAAELKHLVRGLDPERYTRLEELAEGGGGRIERIWDTLLRRSLAMKVAKVRAPGERATRSRQLARFLEEAQVTGQLQHPGIVPIHDVGLDGEGFAFFTMDLVEGIDLGEAFRLARAGEEGWTVQRAVRALASVAETLAYAHDRGVLHRDVKPSNVRVGPFGEVYVMDWGLARVHGVPDSQDVVQSVRSGSGSSAFLTAEGAVMGTAAYMPPEQARGDLAQLDERADVYAVGAMLYELLAGRSPYAEEQRTKTPEEVAATVADRPPPELADLAPDAPPELVSIAERAMARRLEQRYPGMAQLAEELRAYLEGRVVRAHRTGVLVEIQKWVLRNRLSAAALVLLMIALATAAWIQIDRGRKLRRINVDLEHARTDALGEAHFARLAAAQASLRAGNGRAALNHLEACDPELHEWSWRHLDSRARNHEAEQEIRVGFAGPGTFDLSKELGLATGHNFGVAKLEFEGVSVSELVLYDLERGTSEVLPPFTSVARIRFVPGTALVAVLTRSGLELFDLERRETVAGIEGASGMLALSGNGERLATHLQDGSIQICDARDLERIHRWRPESLRGNLQEMALSREGELVACLDFDGALHVIEAGGPLVVSMKTSPPDPAASPPPLAFRADDGQLAIGRSDGTLELFALPGGERSLSSKIFSDRISALAYDPSGARIACAAYDGTLAVFETAKGEPLFQGYGHQGLVVGLGWGADGQELWSASRDGTLRTWRLDRGSGFDLLRARGGMGIQPIVDAQRERVATTDVRGVLLLWDTSTGDVLAHRDFTTLHRFYPTEGAFVPTTGDLVVATRFSGLIRFHADSLEVACRSEFRNGRRLRISADGAYLALERDGEAFVLPVEDLAGEARLPGIENPTAFAFSPGSARLWVGEIRGVLSCWSLAGASPERVTEVSFEAGIVALANLGERLAVGLSDGRIELRSIEDGAQIAHLGRSPGPVERLDFHPGEPLLVSSGVTSGGDTSVRLWNVEALQLRCELIGPAGRLRNAVFGGNGTWIAAQSTEGVVLLDEVPRYRGLALVEAARERARERVFGLYEDWPHPDALARVWETESDAGQYEHRAGRAVAFECWARGALAVRALEELTRKPEEVERHPVAGAILARYVASLYDDAPRLLTAARVLLLAGEAEEAFDLFSELAPSLPEAAPETVQAAEALAADIEAALEE